MSATTPSAVFRPSPPRIARTPQPVRVRALAVVSGVVLCLAAIGMLLIGVLTAFQARRIYRRMARLTALLVLRFYGIRVHAHRRHDVPPGQVVFVSNHTSSLDLFVLVALGLPDCRFFLSGFLRKLVPLGAIAWLLGTFFTVPQDRPAERTRIFERAERVLRRTGESVYLSPEGVRTPGAPGPFNKGAFHLALALGAPIVPFCIRIPAEVDPLLGLDARPGQVDVFFLPPVSTREWTLTGLHDHIAAVHSMLTTAHQELTCPV